MIDAIDLVLLQDILDLAIQGLSGIQIVSKWLFDDHPSPASILLPRKRRCSKLLHNLGKKLGRGRQIEQVVAFCVLRGVDGVEPRPEFRECVRIGKVAALVEQTLTKPLQGTR